MDLNNYRFGLGSRVSLGGYDGTVVQRSRPSLKPEPEYAIDFDEPMLGRRTGVVESQLMAASPVTPKSHSRNDAETGDGLGA